MCNTIRSASCPIEPSSSLFQTRMDHNSTLHEIKSNFAVYLSIRLWIDLHNGLGQTIRGTPSAARRVRVHSSPYRQPGAKRNSNLGRRRQSTTSASFRAICSPMHRRAPAPKGTNANGFSSCALNRGQLSSGRLPQSWKSLPEFFIAGHSPEHQKQSCTQMK